MTDRQLADAAWAELTKTTDSYPAWVRKGSPPTSHWAHAKAFLDQIGGAPPPPPPPPPTTGTDAFKGLNCYRDSDLALARDLTGCKSVRLEMPTAARVQAALNAGQTVLPLAMVSGSHTVPDPATFAAQIVHLYATDWQKPRAVEFHNEPWGSGFWPPKPDPPAYMNALRMFAAAMWHDFPDCLILVASDFVGNTNTSGSNIWLANLIAADTTNLLADPRIRPTVHNYNNSTDVHRRTTQPCWWDFDRYSCIFKAYKDHGHPNPLLWATEWSCGYGSVRDFTDTQQAAYTVEGMKTMRDSGMVEAAFNYMFKTGDTGGDQPFNWLRADNTPKPVCAAVKAL